MLEMCRFFFIFHHILTLNEIAHILSKRTQKNTPCLKNERDDGPHNDGFGIALQKNNRWNITKWIEEPEKDIYGMMKEIEESKIVIIHLRRNCHLGKKCKISTGKKSVENTHPFSYKDAVFAHNGNIVDFEKHKKHLRKFIADDLFRNIRGETDSEWIFFMFLTLLGKKEQQDMNEIHTLLEKWIQHIQSVCQEFTFNIMFSNKEFSVITRYIHYDKTKYNKKQKPNSLYYDTSNGFVVSSEPISMKHTLVPENTAIYVKHTTGHAYLQSINQ
jgi:predicted glutamine amidotransferase